MNPFIPGFRPIGLITVLVLICLVGYNTIDFEQSCVSDGCIAVFMFLLITWGFVGLQLLVMIPIYAVRRKREGLPVAKWVAAWAVVSILPALATHLYLFHLIRSHP